MAYSPPAIGQPVRLEPRFRKGLHAHSALPARAVRCLAALAHRHGHHQADALSADAVDPTEVPDQYHQERRKSRYLEIDEAFIASGHALVRLDLQSRGLTMGVANEGGRRAMAEELTKDVVERRVTGVIDRWVEDRRRLGKTLTIDEQDVRELARNIVNHDFTREEVW